MAHRFASGGAAKRSHREQRLRHRPAAISPMAHSLRRAEKDFADPGHRAKRPTVCIRFVGVAFARNRAELGDAAIRGGVRDQPSSLLLVKSPDFFLAFRFSSRTRLSVASSGTTRTAWSQRKSACFLRTARTSSASFLRIPTSSSLSSLSNSSSSSSNFSRSFARCGGTPDRSPQVHPRPERLSLACRR